MERPKIHSEWNLKEHLYKLISSSGIISFFFWLAEGFSRLVGRSLIARMMTGYEAIQRSFKGGLVHAVSDIFPAEKRLALKRRIAQKFERSKLLSVFYSTIKSLLATPVRGVGVAMFSYGFYACLVYLLRCLVLKYEEIAPIYIAILGIVFAASLILFLINGIIRDVLEQSCICSLLLFGLIGIRTESMNTGESQKLSYLKLYCAGMLAGLLTFVVPPLYLAMGIAGFAGFLFLLKNPEIGIYLIIMLLPFLPTMVMAGLVIVTAACYFLKLIRGKRILRFEIIDTFLALFIATIILAGFVSSGESLSLKHALLFSCFIGGYFIIVNLIQSREMITKSIMSLIFSSGVVALYGVYQNYFSDISTIWQDEEMFKDITGRVISTFDNPNVLGEYLLLAIPICIVASFAYKGWKQLVSIAACVLNISCLVFTWSRGSWLGLIISVAILLVIVNWRFISLYFAGLISIPLLPAILPRSIIDRFMSIGDVKDSSTSYRISIWNASLKMLRDFFDSGVGMGTTAYVAVYPQYSLAGIESAPHSHNLFLQIGIETGAVGLAIFLFFIFLFVQHTFTFIAKQDKELRMFAAAGMCALVGILAQGMTDYIWYNYRVFSMFWIIVALTVAIGRTPVINQSAREEFSWQHES